MKDEYLSFEEARKFVRLLKLNNNREWREYCKSKDKPDNITPNPSGYYKNKGWISWPDWLGYDSKYNKGDKILSFVDARDFILKNAPYIKTPNEYLAFYTKTNPPIPRGAEVYYRNKGQYNGDNFWKDWLGLRDFKQYGKEKEILDFKDALNKIRTYRISGGWNGYNNWYKENKPSNLPINPNVKYKNKGWVDIHHWLGENKMSNFNRNFLNYDEAKNIVHKLNIKSGDDWLKFTKEKEFPKDLPTGPDAYYKNKGWISWGDFLGTGEIAVRFREYLPFEEAKDFIRKLGLKSETEWREYCKSGKKPNNIPTNPQRYYSNE